MLKAIRILISGNVSYEDVTIYSNEDQKALPIPNLFEDSQIIVTCKCGNFIITDYQIVQVHVRKGRIRPPDGCFKILRIRLSDDIQHGISYIVPPEKWDQLGIPMLFRDFEQFVFMNKEGIFITTDFNVLDIRWK